jgi:ribose 1,5-bisphosphokinase PhnN
MTVALLRNIERLETPSGATAEAQGDRLIVRNAQGMVVVVFDAATGTAEISSPSGDLRLAAPMGRVVVAAGSEVVIEAPRTRIEASELELTAGRMEVTAERLVHRAHEMYQEVDEVLHTRAGRVRTLVRGAYHLFSKRLRLVAEEDAAIDGERVLLG